MNTPSSSSTTSHSSGGGGGRGGEVAVISSESISLADLSLAFVPYVAMILCVEPKSTQDLVRDTLAGAILKTFNNMGFMTYEAMMQFGSGLSPMSAEEVRTLLTSVSGDPNIDLLQHKQCFALSMYYVVKRCITDLQAGDNSNTFQGLDARAAAITFYDTLLERVANSAARKETRKRGRITEDAVSKLREDMDYQVERMEAATTKRLTGLPLKDEMGMILGLGREKCGIEASSLIGAALIVAGGEEVGEERRTAAQGWDDEQACAALLNDVTFTLKMTATAQNGDTTATTEVSGDLDTALSNWKTFTEGEFGSPTKATKRTHLLPSRPPSIMSSSSSSLSTLETSRSRSSPPPSRQGASAGAVDQAVDDVPQIVPAAMDVACEEYDDSATRCELILGAVCPFGCGTTVRLSSYTMEGWDLVEKERKTRGRPNNYVHHVESCLLKYAVELCDRVLAVEAEMDSIEGLEDEGSSLLVGHSEELKQARVRLEERFSNLRRKKKSRNRTLDL